MLKIFDLCKDLSANTRWSQVHCLKEESVLEHTAFVAIYALRLGYKYDVNVGDVLERAIVHDMEESITGDIPTPTKYSSPEMTNAIKKLEDSAAIKVSQDYFFGQSYSTWDIAKCLETEEGNIVFLSDAAAVVYKIWLEVSLGNREFLKFKPNIFNHLSEANVLPKFDGEIAELIYSLGEIS